LLLPDWWRMVAVRKPIPGCSWVTTFGLLPSLGCRAGWKLFGGTSGCRLAPWLLELLPLHAAALDAGIAAGGYMRVVVVRVLSA
jgi:hypothetical protein